VARLAKLTGLSAKVTSSWITGQLGRVFTDADQREAAEQLRRVQQAEWNAQTLGEMKGLAMNVGQILSFASDQVPEELRIALTRLQAAREPLPKKTSEEALGF
jgi:predicted unusual protein kinase regulating ubiquinone biosynthesis (AarF/ABC1/UbiB family)